MQFANGGGEARERESARRLEVESRSRLPPRRANLTNGRTDERASERTARRKEKESSCEGEGGEGRKRKKPSTLSLCLSFTLFLYIYLSFSLSLPLLQRTNACARAREGSSRFVVRESAYCMANLETWRAARCVCVCVCLRGYISVRAAARVPCFLLLLPFRRVRVCTRVGGSSAPANRASRPPESRSFSFSARLLLPSRPKYIYTYISV